MSKAKPDPDPAAMTATMPATTTGLPAEPATKPATKPAPYHDLLDFARRPPPTPVAKHADTIRVPGDCPLTMQASIEHAIHAATRAPPVQATSARTAAAAIPVQVRARADPHLLSAALKCFKLVGDRVALEFTPAALRIAALRPGYTMLCRATLARASFAAYVVEGGTTTTFHAAIKPLARALSRAGSAAGSAVSIRVGQHGAAMSIGFLSGKDIKRSITLKHPKDTEPAETALHEKCSPLQCCKATVDKATFARAVQDACLAGDRARLAIAGQRLAIASGDGSGNGAGECGASIPLASCTGAPDPAGLECGVFTARDLAQAASALAAFKVPAITILAGRAVPLTLRVETPATTVDFMLAHHVERADETDEGDEDDGADNTDKDGGKAEDKNDAAPGREYRRDDDMADETTDEPITTPAGRPT